MSHVLSAEFLRAAIPQDHRPHWQTLGHQFGDFEADDEPLIVVRRGDAIELPSRETQCSCCRSH